jgi:hypothetical protein
VEINASVTAAGELLGDATVLRDDEVLETKVEYTVERSEWQSEAQWQQQQQVLCAHCAPWTRIVPVAGAAARCCESLHG